MYMNLKVYLFVRIIAICLMYIYNKEESFFEYHILLSHKYPFSPSNSPSTLPHILQRGPSPLRISPSAPSHSPQYPSTGSSSLSRRWICGRSQFGHLHVVLDDHLLLVVIVSRVEQIKEFVLRECRHVFVDDEGR